MTIDAFEFLSSTLGGDVQLTALAALGIEQAIIRLGPGDINDYDDNGAMLTLKRADYLVQVGCYVQASTPATGNDEATPESVRVIVSDEGTASLLGDRAGVNHLGEIEAEWRGIELDDRFHGLRALIGRTFGPVTDVA